MASNRESTPRAQLCAIEPEDPDADDTATAEAREQTRAGADAQVEVQRAGEVDGSGGHAAAREVVAREQTRSVLRVSEGDVDEDLNLKPVDC